MWTNRILLGAAGCVHVCAFPAIIISIMNVSFRLEMHWEENYFVRRKYFVWNASKVLGNRFRSYSDLIKLDWKKVLELGSWTRKSTRNRQLKWWLSRFFIRMVNRKMLDSIPRKRYNQFNLEKWNVVTSNQRNFNGRSS